MACYLVVLLVLSLFVSRNDAVNTGFFWHLTDIHVDQNYSRTGNPLNLCHNEKASFPDTGLYGNFLCDSPQSLVDVTFKAMKKIKSDPDFIIWTGDNLPHTSGFDPDWNVIYEALHNVTTLFDENFPGVPVFPCIGNHDTFPPNMLLPNDTSKSIYAAFLKKGGWSKYLNDESVATFIKGGYFSQNIKSDLRIISLNTILWYTPNYFTEKMSDPADQFEWMEEILSNCSKKLEKVYIIGHVPPGFYNRVKHGQKSSPTYHLQYIDAYLKILKKFSKIILGQMFGHLHMDMFQIFQLGSGYFVSSSVLASSVTPWHFISKDNVSLPVNPSVRLMHFDRETGLLKDYDQFYFNLTKANNMTKTEEPVDLYKLLYTFTKSYNVSDLSTESLVEVYEKIKANDNLFNKFYKFSTAGKESVLCDAFCKSAQLCAISSLTMDEYSICMKNNSGSNLTCYKNFANDQKKLANLFSYVLVVVLSCLSILFLILVYRRYKRSHNDIYTKLLRDF